jgi:hypothetical protein
MAGIWYFIPYTTPSQLIDSSAMSAQHVRGSGKSFAGTAGYSVSRRTRRVAPSPPRRPVPYPATFRYRRCARAVGPVGES